MTANIHTSTRLQLPSPPLSQAFHMSELQWPVGYCRWWWCVTTGKEEATISSKLTWSKLMVAVKALEANASWININKCTVELITVIRTHKMAHGISALYRTHTTCRSLMQIPNGHLCSKRGERQSARYNEGLHLAPQNSLHLAPVEYRECHIARPVTIGKTISSPGTCTFSKASKQLSVQPSAKSSVQTWKNWAMLMPTMKSLKSLMSFVRTMKSSKSKNILQHPPSSPCPQLSLAEHILGFAPQDLCTKDVGPLAVFKM